ncbi:PAS domain-containing protein [Rhodovibrionaceae bacterium A322]
MIEKQDEKSPADSASRNWDIPVLEIALLQQVYDRWQALCRGSELPLATALDALDFMPFTSHIILAEVLPDGDLEFRLVGEEIVAVRGAAMKGMRLSEFQIQAGDNPSLSQFKVAVEQCVPQYYDGPAYNFRKEYLRARRLILPFVGEEGNCQKILMVAQYSQGQLN